MLELVHRASLSLSPLPFVGNVVDGCLTASFVSAFVAGGREPGSLYMYMFSVCSPGFSSLHGRCVATPLVLRVPCMQFGGADDDEGCDDAAVTKLDHFWQFGDIEASHYK